MKIVYHIIQVITRKNNYGSSIENNMVVHSVIILVYSVVMIIYMLTIECNYFLDKYVKFMKEVNLNISLKEVLKVIYFLIKGSF